MTDASVRALEGEVETARARLANHLRVLRSPDTAADFTRALKQEAKSGLDSTVSGIIEDLKGRAAANPAAALAIGAGIAWRLVRHPPIATVLIGGGLVSLFRTTPTHAIDDAGYLSQAKRSLGEQASRAADYAAEQTGRAVDYAGEQAVQMSSRAKEQAAELASAAKQRAREWVSEATSSGTQAVSDLQERASSISSQVSSQVSDAASGMRDRAAVMARDYSQSAQQLINDADAKDKLLLGGAALAVVAALGIALHRGLAEADSPG